MSGVEHELVSMSPRLETLYIEVYSTHPRRHLEQLQSILSEQHTWH